MSRKEQSDSNLSPDNNISRRTMMQVGFGAAAVVVAGNAIPKPAGEGTCDTPAQPAGPFYPKQFPTDTDIDLTQVDGQEGRADGDIIYVSGQVLDEDLKPVSGALVEIWQANKHGRYDHEDDPSAAPLDPNFQGFGQVRTGEDGNYGFKTIFPGAYPVNEDWTRTPHIHFKIARRGYHELITQLYFAGQELNADDLLVQQIPEDDRGRVIADLVDGREGDEAGARRCGFNIVLKKV